MIKKRRRTQGKELMVSVGNLDLVILGYVDLRGTTCDRYVDVCCLFNCVANMPIHVINVLADGFIVTFF